MTVTFSGANDGYALFTDREWELPIKADHENRTFGPLPTPVSGWYSALSRAVAYELPGPLVERNQRQAGASTLPTKATVIFATWFTYDA